jgi:hypothetical protein
MGNDQDSLMLDGVHYSDLIRVAQFLATVDSDALALILHKPSSREPGYTSNKYKRWKTCCWHHGIETGARGLTKDKRQYERTRRLQERVGDLTARLSSHVPVPGGK